jgi:hypothetical protein
MKCPGCGAQAGDVECAACGLVFAKMLKVLEPKPTPPPNLWLGRMIAAVVVVAWLSGLAAFYLVSRKPR